MIFVICLLFTAVSSTGWAKSCKRNNLKGTWYVYVFGANSESDTGWVNALIKIKQNGDVVPGTRYVLDDGTTGQITGGKLNISKNCVISGNVLGKADGDERPARIITINHGTIDRSKEEMNGVGTDNDGDHGIFTAIKR